MDGPRIAAGRVVLRPLEPRDRDARRALGWWASIERGFGHLVSDRPMTAAEAGSWYDAQRARALDAGTVSWVVEVDGDLAGEALLHSWRREDEKARYAVGLLHPRFLGRGLGREVTALVLDHAFGPMGLHRVDLRVLAENTAAVACYAACGFVVEGRERESCLLDGVRLDDLVMAVLAPERPSGAR